MQTTMKAIQVSSLGSSHMEVIGVLGMAGIIWYGGYLVIHDEMTPGAFFSFLAAIFMAYAPIRRLSGANNTVQQALAAAERVFERSRSGNRAGNQYGIQVTYRRLPVHWSSGMYASATRARR